MRDRDVSFPLILLSVNGVEQIMYFFIPIVMIFAGIYFLFLHRRKCPHCKSSIRPFWSKCSCASEPSIVFPQEPVEEQENGLVADMRPFSRDQKPEEKREIGSTVQVTSFSFDDAQPLSGERVGTAVMLPSISPAWLLIEELGMPEKRYEIKEMVTSIGNSSDNDIVLNDRAVSRHHVRIKLEGKKYFIYDLVSTNGTRVNGRKITKKWIKEGDIIEMGHTRIAFKTEEKNYGLKKQRAAARSQHLSGNLKYFDLPFIIQTLTTSERTGTLTITNQLERIFAVLYFEAGDVLFAKLGHLRGEEAFYQLFQSPAQDAFTFKGGLPPLEFEDTEEIGTTTTVLLMEAAHQQDELKAMKATYVDANRVFRPQSETLLWDDEETKDLAQEIWARLHRGETIAQMVREITTCEYRIYNVLSLMDSKGLIRQ
jgi:hypothetical protein